MGVKFGDKMIFYETWLVQASWNINNFQLTIHMLTKLTTTLEGDLIFKITKVRFQLESQTGLNSEWTYFGRLSNQNR